MSETRSANGDSGSEPGTAPNRTPGQTEQFARLRDVLREMFQLDRGDLDFGLYRIMNLKRAEVERFLGEDLLPQARALLDIAIRKSREERLADAEEQARGLGVNPADSPKIRQLRADVERVSPEGMEGDVYKDLANFFERYYRDGDFAAQRRYSAGGAASYLIPYDGEEVKLHRANADQYYIKTTDNYASYVFRLVSESGTDGDRRVRFEIASAVGTRDNVKEVSRRARRFILAGGKDAVAVDVRSLVVRFEHRPLSDGEKRRFPGNGSTQQGKLNEDAAARILRAAPADWRAGLAYPAPTESCPERTTLARHLAAYTAKNSFDYFIHKDLGGFLRRELDMYLKTEVLVLDDLEPGNSVDVQRALARMKATKVLGEKIIAFLAQLEDFQKRLWLKKKFVLETQHCVTLDRVPAALYAEIAANEAQREEWETLYAISEIPPSLPNGGGGGRTLTQEFLQANPYLVLDTRHFGGDFKDRLLAALSATGPLDEAQDGLLVHGENFQALNLLGARYQGEAPCAYLDPPYNTGDSEIPYNNGYPRSSWLSLLSDRLGALAPLLSTDSVLFLAIDDFEMVNLSMLIDQEFPIWKREMVVVNHHPQGGKQRAFANTHEYMLVCLGAKSERTLAGRNSHVAPELRPFKRSGTAESNYRAGRPNSFYAILVDPASAEIVGLERPPKGADYPLGTTDEDYARVYPLGSNGEERVWRRSYESALPLVEQRKLRCSDALTIYQLIEPEEKTSALFSNWVDSRYNAGVFGANLLREIIGESNPFAYPKSVHTVEDAISCVRSDARGLVVDCFAGSGTTGHAVLNLNREDGTRRRYLLVEMADYFDTVLLPRLKKVVHSPDWKDGKPLSRKGISQFFRYLRIESYEDTMDSLTLVPRNEGTLGLHPDVIEDYRLRYAIDTETNGSATLLGSEFEDPFRYTLSVVRDGERRETPVDLPETFNLLLGLRERSRRRLDGVLAIEGEDADGIRCLILWRNRREKDNRALDAWFGEHRPRFATFDRVYANGDHTLNAVAAEEDSWTAFPIEPEFRRLMFEET